MLQAALPDYPGCIAEGALKEFEDLAIKNVESKEWRDVPNEVKHIGLARDKILLLEKDRNELVHPMELVFLLGYHLAPTGEAHPAFKYGYSHTRGSCRLPSRY